MVVLKLLFWDREKVSAQRLTIRRFRKQPPAGSSSSPSASRFVNPFKNVSRYLDIEETFELCGESGKVYTQVFVREYIRSYR